mgnify:CR=1 FL=1
MHSLSLVQNTSTILKVGADNVILHKRNTGFIFSKLTMYPLMGKGVLQPIINNLNIKSLVFLYKTNIQSLFKFFYLVMWILIIEFQKNR